jgi:hypothetical protein
MPVMQCTVLTGKYGRSGVLQEDRCAAATAQHFLLPGASALAFGKFTHYQQLIFCTVPLLRLFALLWLECFLATRVGPAHLSDGCGHHTVV